MKPSLSRASTYLTLLAVLLGPLAPRNSSAQSPESGLIRRHPEAVPLEECFPIDTLPAESRERSRELLLEALDSEALYTIVGDLKPVSEGFFGKRYPVEPADASELAEIRQALSAWQCGTHFESGVLPFHSLHEGGRFASAWIASRPALDRKLDEHSDFFHRLGMTRGSSAEAVLLRIEGADNISERWKGFGLAFGYPEHAVDFFVRAGVHAATTGEFVQRDFRNYPTHARATGDFVYAVPKLEPPSDAEELLRRKVEAILTSYRGLRRKYVEDDDSERVVDLLCDWFDDGTGWCHPDHALQKAMTWDEAREWVENAAIPLTTVLPTDPLEELEPLDAVLRDRRIIALGESTHGTREFFQLKHRMFRYLVENHGARLFGIEASYAACLPIDDYVQTGEGDPRAALKGQGFWTWDTEEVLALVEWMRTWNEHRPAGADPVRFYGFDTQDAYTPLKLVLDDLAKSRPGIATRFRDRLSIALEEQYGPALDDATRDQLELLLTSIEELKSLYSSREGIPGEERRRIQLLLEQASAAIRIDVSQRDQWSSLGIRRELDLYARIRAKLPELEPELANLQGERIETLMAFVSAAADLGRCRRRFRDELNEEQRQDWRDAVRWGIEYAPSSAAKATLMELQTFLEVATEYVDKPKELVNTRDETMADFVSAILGMHGEKSRIALWAHDWHISKFDGNPAEDMPRMGTFLERRYGEDYLPIGLSFGSGEFQALYDPEESEDPAKRVLRAFRLDGSRHDSFSHLFDQCEISASAHLLSESFTEGLPRWLSQPHAHRTIGAIFQPRLENSDAYYERMVLPRHFEIVMHVRETERSRPLRPVARFRFGAKLGNVDRADDEGKEPPPLDTKGILVKSVPETSLAERCGLQAGDRIIRFGDQRVTSVDGFQLMLADIDRPGSHEITVLRERRSNDGRATVQEVLLYLIVPPWIAD